MANTKKDKSQLDKAKPLLASAGVDANELLTEIAEEVAKRIDFKPVIEPLMDKVTTTLAEAITEIDKKTAIKLANEIEKINNKLSVAISNIPTLEQVDQRINESWNKNIQSVVNQVSDAMTQRAEEIQSVAQPTQRTSGILDILKGADLTQITGLINALSNSNNPFGALAKLKDLKDQLDPIVNILYPSTGLTPAQEASIGQKFFEEGYKFRINQEKSYSPKAPNSSENTSPVPIKASRNSRKYVTENSENKNRSNKRKQIESQRKPVSTEDIKKLL